MRLNFAKGTYGELHKSIKENYTKWVTTKLKSEKDYYATTTINFIERDIIKHNFLKMILKSVILIYHGSFFNPAQGIELLRNSAEIIDSLRLNEQIKSELKYTICLYIGFAHLKTNDFEQANIAFRGAIDVKPCGTTAKIYCALTEIYREQPDLTAFFLKEIFEYDRQRLALAIRASNSGMFSYFFRNCFICNIFHEKEFGRVTDVIEGILTEHRFHESDFMELNKGKLENLKNKKLDEYYDEEIKKAIAFIEKMFQNYNTCTNTLFYSIYGDLQGKLGSIAEAITENVKKKFYSEVREKLSNYEVMIKDNVSAEKHLHDELEKFKVRSKENLEEMIKKLNSSYEAEKDNIEQKINDLSKYERFNASASMSTNMTYNIIVAFVVFFLGGIAGYSNRLVSDAYEFNSIFLQVFILGSKWGAISFVVGTVISVIIAGIIVAERMDMKKKLQNKIGHLKIERDRMLHDAKESTIQKEKIMNDTITNGINSHRKRVEELNVQKEDLEKLLIKEADVKIREVVAGLETFQ